MNSDEMRSEISNLMSETTRISSGSAVYPMILGAIFTLVMLATVKAVLL